jgi:hypothetical protein
MMRGRANLVWATALTLRTVQLQLLRSLASGLAEL